MARRDPHRVAARIVQDAGGKVVGRTRMQKITYLAQLAGFPAEFAFEYRHYGPFSEDLATGLETAAALGHLREEVRESDWGAPTRSIGSRKSGRRRIRRARLSCRRPRRSARSNWSSPRQPPSCSSRKASAAKSRAILGKRPASANRRNPTKDGWRLLGGPMRSCAGYPPRGRSRRSLPFRASVRAERHRMSRERPFAGPYGPGDGTTGLAGRTCRLGDRGEGESAGIRSGGGVAPARLRGRRPL